MCTGNTIKTTVGNTANCNATCDGIKEVANENHTMCGEFTCYRSSFVAFGEYCCLYIIHENVLLFSECNAGYYKESGNGCVLCPGNQVKSSSGDDTDCNTDTACNGHMTVPNLGHTACDKNVFELVASIKIKLFL